MNNYRQAKSGVVENFSRVGEFHKRQFCVCQHVTIDVISF